ncbi:hypothetical protein [Marilutibacter alkalisoli]|uniref:YggN family protein n=1 Tax=Marilutibacter alkalisoli TaxID=2591633 RepID=A0A514BSE1_9GAMM|nr:hypothetical protein [Lysobacter alkalisoli]QDH69939.1 hypothetical protein FKV23_07410 [Lysobacter alkalisoli]
MNIPRILPLVLCLLLPLAAQASDGKPSGIAEEVRQELADARKEVQTELAEARRELETENLRVDNSFQFGQSGKQRTDLPRAEITPDGDFLIQGQPQVITTAQREELLAYRGLVVGIAQSGIDIGQRSAEAVIDAMDRSWVGLVFSAMTGSLERRIERSVKTLVEPMVQEICLQLPAMMQSQQRLAAGLPQFQPYATLEADDVEDCENQIRHEFATR